MSAIQLLQDASNLLYSPHRWTRNATARNSNGDKINLYSNLETPYSFDAQGALIYSMLQYGLVETSKDYREAYQLLCLVARDKVAINDTVDTTMTSLPYYLRFYNDHYLTTFADVVNLYSCALPMMIYTENWNKDVRRIA